MHKKLKYKIFLGNVFGLNPIQLIPFYKHLLGQCCNKNKAHVFSEYIF